MELQENNCWRENHCPVKRSYKYFKKRRGLDKKGVEEKREECCDPKTHDGISQNSIDKDKKLIKKIIATAIIAVFLPTF